MRLSSATSSARRAGCSVRYFTDSGSANSNTAAIASGASPPTQNRMRQPWTAMNFAAIRPGRPPPNVTPVNISTTMVARACFGANSLISDTMIGSVPASATPARMRVRTS